MTGTVPSPLKKPKIWIFLISLSGTVRPREWAIKQKYSQTGIIKEENENVSFLKDLKSKFEIGILLELYEHSSSGAMNSASDL